MTQNPDWGGKREGAGRPRAFSRVKVADLQALVANWQALCNLAEAKAPHLLEDREWLGIKMYLEEQAQKLGVHAWIDARAEKNRQRIEKEEDSSEYEHPSSPQ